MQPFTLGWGKEMAVLSNVSTSLTGVLAACLLAGEVAAAQVKYTDIHRAGKRYFIQAEASFAVAKEQVLRVLMDFEHLNRLHWMIRESRVLEKTPEGIAWVQIETMPCVAFLCFDIVQVTEFSQAESGDLKGWIDPTRSDFRFGELSWNFMSGPDNETLVRFGAVLEPSFWIPPVIGPWILQSKLKELAMIFTEELEKLALQDS
jgi:hypothetical protein